MDTELKGLGAFLDRLSRESGTEVNAITLDRAPSGDIPFIVIDGNRKVHSAASVVQEFEKTQAQPYRRRGIYQAASVDSLLRWMHAHTDDDAPVFGVGLESLNGEWRQPKLALVGIGNYSDGKTAAWHDYGARYDFPVSHAWTVWASGHTEEGDPKPKWFTQADFAEFIEARIHELSSPLRGEVLSEAVTRFLEASAKKDHATPAEMFKISRELKLMSDEKIEAKIDLTSGETQMQYSAEHTGPGGRPVKIPSLFYIRIPVFFGQDPVLIGVKLRYRAGGGQVVWSYSLFAPDMVVADEFEKACETVKNSKHPLYLGSPDKPV